MNFCILFFNLSKARNGTLGTRIEKLTSFNLITKILNLKEFTIKNLSTFNFVVYLLPLKTSFIFFFLFNCGSARMFDFGFKKLFNKRLAFPPLYRDFYRLLLATSENQWVPRMLFVL